MRRNTQQSETLLKTRLVISVALENSHDEKGGDGTVSAPSVTGVSRQELSSQPASTTANVSPSFAPGVNIPIATKVRPTFVRRVRRLRCETAYSLGVLISLLHTFSYMSRTFFLASPLTSSSCSRLKKTKEKLLAKVYRCSRCWWG
ncbi:hypothetical protein E2C01_006701 [Portunus trituberculatus]|uniref:Uncharacterized protein n=1 Tax=Portunus trituberculatus TaxID=210409 RepID=A0A5B7CX13_PORTR|nr:hypothetical protein [Portunus trituberculatus]